MQNSLEKKTKTEIAVVKLETAIIDCQIAPGAVMTEAEISEFLGIGRTPVREALVKLAHENLVRLSRAGIVIPELNPLTILKLLEPRALIERLCIEKAIERIDDADKALINDVIIALQELRNDDRKGFMEILSRIHDIMAQSSKNEFILSSIKATQGLSRRFWNYYSTDEDQKYCTNLYIKEMQALIDQDKTKALDASAELMRYLRDFTNKRVEFFNSTP